MKKYLLGAVIVIGILISPMFMQAAVFTDPQMQAILSLLSSFGADSATIANVRTALGGGTPTPVNPSFCYDFSANLGVGASGSAVTALQTALQKDGGSISITNSFDEQTASTVTGFQEKYANDILASVGLQHGTGYVGPSTRAKLNSLYGCNATSYLTITTNFLAGGTVGASYSAPLSASGGSDTYKWLIAGLPAGLNMIVAVCSAAGSPLQSCLSSATAQISGTPATAGIYTVAITVTSGTQSVSKQFNLVIDPAGACVKEGENLGAVHPGNTSQCCAGLEPYIEPGIVGTRGICKKPATFTIITDSLPSGMLGTPYDSSVTATGGNGSYNWSITGLPPGLGAIVVATCSSDASNSSLQSCPTSFAVQISGTPSAAGNYTVTITLTDGTLQKVSKQFSLAIAAALP